MSPTDELNPTLTRASYATLPDAIGTIGPKANQQERLDELTYRLAAGEFHVATDAIVAASCIDGRPGAVGALRANTAGGTETIMVADDLTAKRLAGDGSTLEAYVNTASSLQAKGLPVGGHDDDHAQGEASGCGANDKLQQIYEFLAGNGDAIRQAAASIGVEVDDATHQLIVGNAQARIDGAGFSSGRQLLEALRAAAGDEVVDNLTGSHEEVVAVINLRAGITLDRPALADEFGLEYQAFNVDAWTFARMATELSDGDAEAAQKTAAMVYYNLATAHVLTNSQLRVVVLK